MGWKQKLVKRAISVPQIPVKWIAGGLGVALGTIVLAVIVPNMSWGDVGNAWLFLLFAIPLLIVACIGLVLYAGYQRAQVVRVKDGLVPIHKSQLPQLGAQSLGAHWQVEHMKATHQPVPENFSGTWNMDAKVMEPATLEPALVKVPTIMELMEAGELRAGQPIYIGITPEAEVVRQKWMEDIGSFFSLGASGAGKTTGALGMAVQVLIEAMERSVDGKCILIGDPHAGDDESLATQFEGLNQFLLHPVAATEQEILAMAEKLASIVDYRIANPRPKSDPWPPIFALVDEWLRLYRSGVGKQLDALFCKVATEGRKKNMNVGLFTQGGTKDLSGDVRALATTTFVYRSRADQARYALGEKLPISPRGFRDGQCYVQTRHGQWNDIQQPYIGVREVADLGRMFAARASEAQVHALPRSFKVLPGRAEALPEHGGPLPTDAEAQDAEVVRGANGSGLEGVGRIPSEWEARLPAIFQAFRNGVAPTDVRRTVLNVGSSGREATKAKKWLEWLLWRGEWRKEGE